MQIYTVQAYENQLSDFLATHIEENFPEFEVVREAQIANHFSPFFRSRRDFYIYRNDETSGAVVSITDDDDHFDALTLELKNHEDESDKDKYQLVASMEITAAQVVEQQLVKKHKVNKIKLIGALLNYKTKTCTIYILTINFETNKSVVEQSQQIQNISTVMQYVFSQI